MGYARPASGSGGAVVDALTVTVVVGAVAMMDAPFL
jgi:hypothetical protein